MTAGATLNLLDPLTGRVALLAASDLPGFSGVWTLEIDGRRAAGGKFLGEAMSAGERREIPLSVETPPTFPGETIVLHVTLDRLGEWTFPLPPYRLMPFPRPKFVCTTGVRADAAQAILSGGKLSAVVTADGLRELRYKGRPLLASAMRLKLTGDGPEPDERIRALELPRLPVHCDRFAADAEGVECHALVLPKKMALDELEFTQRFVPLTEEAIRCELGFAVPDSFAGVPMLGVRFELSPELTRATFFHTADGRFTATTAASAEPGAHRADFAAFRDDSGAGLLVTAAGAALTILTASEDGKPEIALACRIREDGPIAAGDFRTAFCFAPLTGESDPARIARRLRLG